MKVFTGLCPLAKSTENSSSIRDFQRLFIPTCHWHFGVQIAWNSRQVLRASRNMSCTKTDPQVTSQWPISWPRYKCSSRGQRAVTPLVFILQTSWSSSQCWALLRFEQVPERVIIQKAKTFEMDNATHHVKATSFTKEEVQNHVHTCFIGLKPVACGDAKPCARHDRINTVYHVTGKSFSITILIFFFFLEYNSLVGVLWDRSKHGNPLHNYFIV